MLKRILTIAKHLRYFRGNIINFRKSHPQLPLPKNIWQYFPEWHSYLNPTRNAMADKNPWITIGALHWLNNHVQGGWNVFEYGMGGSTLY